MSDVNKIEIVIRKVDSHHMEFSGYIDNVCSGSEGSREIGELLQIDIDSYNRVITFFGDFVMRCPIADGDSAVEILCLHITHNDKVTSLTPKSAPWLDWSGVEVQILDLVDFEEMGRNVSEKRIEGLLDLWKGLYRGKK